MNEPDQHEVGDERNSAVGRQTSHPAIASGVAVARWLAQRGTDCHIKSLAALSWTRAPAGASSR
jgi:hypothetical protein